MGVVESIGSRTAAPTERKKAQRLKPITVTEGLFTGDLDGKRIEKTDSALAQNEGVCEEVIADIGGLIGSIRKFVESALDKEKAGLIEELSRELGVIAGSLNEALQTKDGEKIDSSGIKTLATAVINDLYNLVRDNAFTVEQQNETTVKVHAEGQKSATRLLRLIQKLMEIVDEKVKSYRTLLQKKIRDEGLIEKYKDDIRRLTRGEKGVEGMEKDIRRESERTAARIEDAKRHLPRMEKNLNELKKIVANFFAVRAEEELESAMNACIDGLQNERHISKKEADDLKKQNGALSFTAEIPLQKAVEKKPEEKETTRPARTETQTAKSLSNIRAGTAAGLALAVVVAVIALRGENAAPPLPSPAGSRSSPTSPLRPVPSPASAVSPTAEPPKEAERAFNMTSPEFWGISPAEWNEFRQIDQAYRKARTGTLEDKKEFLRIIGVDLSRTVEGFAAPHYWRPGDTDKMQAYERASYELSTAIFHDHAFKNMCRIAKPALGGSIMPGALIIDSNGTRGVDAPEKIDMEKTFMIDVNEQPTMGVATLKSGHRMVYRYDPKKYPVAIVTADEKRYPIINPPNVVIKDDPKMRAIVTLEIWREGEEIDFSSNESIDQLFNRNTRGNMVQDVLFDIQLRKTN